MGNPLFQVRHTSLVRTDEGRTLIDQNLAPSPTQVDRSQIPALTVLPAVSGVYPAPDRFSAVWAERLAWSRSLHESEN